MSGTVRLLLICLLLMLSSALVFGQDLGSSNKLFGGSKPAPATKKTPSKRRTTPVKVKHSPTAKAKPANNRKSKETKAAPTGRSGAETSAKKAEPVIIKTGPIPAKTEAKAERPAVADPPVNAAADELYEKLIEDGNSARDERNYAAAESAYKRASGIKPRDSRAVFGLGNLFSDQQRWDDAEKQYREAIKLDPDNAIVHIALSYVLSQPIAANDLGDRYEEAERLARKATQLEPQNALAFDQLGVAMELRGLISIETENAYRTAISLEPSFAPPYAHLGRLLRRRGRSKEAAEAYEKAVRYSTDVPTMILVAGVMQSEQRYKDSEPLLRAAVGNDPRNPSGLLLLGQSLLITGKYDDAERFLKRSVEVSPNAFMSNNLLGSLYIRRGKFDLAENSLMQALMFVSPNEKRRLALEFAEVGDGYLKSGKTINAQRAYQQAAKLDAENQTIAAKLARAQHR